MARILIVGCGCRGRSLAAELVAAGHAVRGTTRHRARMAEIEAAGAEGILADPDRLGGVTGALAGVTLVCWLMADAVATPALHGDRLRTLTERLVDTPVRGLVYEAAGTVDPELLAAGAAIVREASATWHIPVEVVDVAPGDGWLEAMTGAVEGLLA